VSFQCESVHDESWPARDCFACSMEFEASMRCLSANLAIAGGLTKAYLIGFVRGFYYEVDTSMWKPGCGRPCEP
jgi:hypothetical protein